MTVDPAVLKVADAVGALMDAVRGMGVAVVQAPPGTGKTTTVARLLALLAEQAALVRGAIEHGGRDDFAAVLQAIRASGAIEATRKAAEDEAERALNALNVLPSSVFKSSLVELSKFAVARKY